MSFGFEKALEIMKNGGYVLLEMDAYFLHNGVFYKDEPAYDEKDNVIYGVNIRELKGFTAEEVLWEDWCEGTKKL